MTLPEASYLAAAIFFSVYGVFAAVECGVVTRLAFRAKTPTRVLFTPLWEVTNVFLVFGFTSLAMLFGDSLATLSHALLSTVLVGLVALLLRACLVISLFYLNPRRVSGLLRWLLLALNYLVPLSFLAAGAYLLTGGLFWESSYGWALMGSGLIGLLAVGLLFADSRFASGNRIARLLAVGWFACLGCFLPLASLHSGDQLLGWPSLTLVGLSIVGLGLVITDSRFKGLLLWRYALVAAVASSLIIAWGSVPYLIYGQMTLADAFSGQAYAGFFLVVSALLVPLVIFGGWLLYKLLGPAKSSGSNGQ